MSMDMSGHIMDMDMDMPYTTASDMSGHIHITITADPSGDAASTPTRIPTATSTSTPNQPAGLSKTVLGVIAALGGASVVFVLLGLWFWFFRRRHQRREKKNGISGARMPANSVTELAPIEPTNGPTKPGPVYNTYQASDDISMFNQAAISPPLHTPWSPLVPKSATASSSLMSSRYPTMTLSPAPAHLAPPFDPGYLVRSRRDTIEIRHSAIHDPYAPSMCSAADAPSTYRTSDYTDLPPREWNSVKGLPLEEEEFEEEGIDVAVTGCTADEGWGELRVRRGSRDGSIHEGIEDSDQRWAGARNEKWDKAKALLEGREM